MEIIFTTVIIAALIVSSLYVVQKRKKHGLKGIKSALTPICFSLIALLQLAAYWFHFLGVVSVAFTIVLLLAGAYFTKYSIVEKPTSLEECSMELHFSFFRSEWK
ncbi:hypothetical protein [Priestia flexa]|uniref:hypothetical protein n=1 Tax=Priestia flexa TaxID=86664 RepID=UPI001F5DE928|nr:hypothetical protein [Priestia flexa]